MRNVDHFGSVNLFYQLTGQELEIFRGRFQKTNFKAGEYIFMENDPGDSLYIIEKGVVTLKKRINAEVEKNIFVATAGTVFGEFSFMDGGERSASAVVDEEAELISLKREAFDEFVAENPSAGAKLFSNLLYILIDRLRKTNDAYLDAVRWGLELTGTLKLNFQYLITDDVDICIELLSNRTFEGRVLQLERSDAGHEIVLLDREGKLTMIPYHAIASITVVQPQAV